MEGPKDPKRRTIDFFSRLFDEKSLVSFGLQLCPRDLVKRVVDLLSLSLFFTWFI